MDISYPSIPLHEPYVLAPQASNVMLLDDRTSSIGYKYVQKFEPRNMYDMAENEKTK